LRAAATRTFGIRPDSEQQQRGRSESGQIASSSNADVRNPAGWRAAATRTFGIRPDCEQQQRGRSESGQIATAINDSSRDILLRFTINDACDAKLYCVRFGFVLHCDFSAFEIQFVSTLCRERTTGFRHCVGAVFRNKTVNDLLISEIEYKF
jgi:hypothetical protein